MEKTKEELKKETEKMLVNIRKKRKTIKLVNEEKAGLVTNIDAYISDTSYFLKNDDQIRAFEAVVWAWSWIEILEELKVIKTE